MCFRSRQLFSSEACWSRATAVSRKWRWRPYCVRPSRRGRGQTSVLLGNGFEREIASPNSVKCVCTIYMHGLFRIQWFVRNMCCTCFRMESHPMLVHGRCTSWGEVVGIRRIFRVEWLSFKCFGNGNPCTTNRLICCFFLGWTQYTNNRISCVWSSCSTGYLWPFSVHNNKQSCETCHICTDISQVCSENQPPEEERRLDCWCLASRFFLTW